MTNEQKLRETLEFYADDQNFLFTREYGLLEYGERNIDLQGTNRIGHKAREAIAATAEQAAPVTASSNKPSYDDLCRAICIYQERTGQTLGDTLAGKWTNPAPDIQETARNIAIEIVTQSHRHHLRKDNWGNADFQDWIAAALQTERNAKVPQ